MSKTVYLKLNQITEIHRKDVALKDVAEVYCEDKNIQNKCSAMKVKHITGDRKHRYVMSALEVIEKLEQLDSAIQVNNVGEVDFIIAYQPPTPPMYAWQWAKTLFVCAVCFCGAASAWGCCSNRSSKLFMTDYLSFDFGFFLGLGGWCRVVFWAAFFRGAAGSS